MVVRVMAVIREGNRVRRPKMEDGIEDGIRMLIRMW
jgi:hypothetical protein